MSEEIKLRSAQAHVWRVEVGVKFAGQITPRTTKLFLTPEHSAARLEREVIQCESYSVHEEVVMLSVTHLGTLENLGMWITNDEHKDVHGFGYGYNTYDMKNKQ